MRLIHASGRFDRGVRIRRATTKKQRQSVDVIARTEATGATVARSRTWAVLRRPGATARGDCTIEHRRDTWRRNSGRVVLVSAAYRLGRRCWVVVARLERRSDGYPLTVITAHLPASVEPQIHGWAHARTARTRLDRQASAWVDAVTGLRRVIAEEHDQRPAATIVVTADWNIDVRQPWARNLLQRELGDVVTLAAPDRPWTQVPGTHGRRVIDWAAASKPAVVQVLSATRASDHRPIRVTW